MSTRLCASVLSLLLLLVPATAIAQSSPVAFGVKAGLNYGQLGGDELVSVVDNSVFADVEVSEGPRIGLVLGGFATIDFDGPVSVQPELLYVQKGHEIDLTLTAFGQSASGAYAFKFSYLELPVLARYEIPMDDYPGLSPYVVGGPTLSYNLSSSFDSDVNGGLDTIDLSSEMRALDLGLALGVGAGLELVQGTATLDARIGLGLNRVFDGSEGAYRHRGLMITAGYVF